MVTLTSLWLPIVVSAAIVFVASAIIHMALRYHYADLRGLPREDELMAALRPFGITPGDYVLPYAASPDRRKQPEFKEKLNKGPVALMTVLPSGPIQMGSSLMQWFVYCALVSVVAAYVGSRALPPGADYLSVFRFAGTTAFCCYAMGLPQHSIWFKRNWGTTMRSMFDGLVYATLTAGTFGWLWPD